MQEAFMRRAIELARNCSATGAGGPFGAVIVQAGRIVGEGSNQVTGGNDPTAHAEIVAIRAACRSLGTFSLAGAEIYTSCEPCPMCLGAIWWARLDRIYYGADQACAAAAGFDDARFYRELARDAAQRSVASVRLLADEAAVPFAEWVRNPGKTPY
jgi:guanine deaminase